MNALATQNSDWGFRGTATRNGYDPQMTWNAAAMFWRQPLTSRMKRSASSSMPALAVTLADDLSFIEGGPIDPEAIERHMMVRLADQNWRKWFETAVGRPRRRLLRMPGFPDSGAKFPALGKESQLLSSVQLPPAHTGSDPGAP